MNIIYELDTKTYTFLIILLSVLFVLCIFIFAVITCISIKLKSKLLAIFDLFIVFGMVSLLILDTQYISFLYKMEHQQYNKICGTISIMSKEESLSKYKKEPDYICTIKIGNETVSDVILSSDAIDRINKNPEVEFYYGTVSGENIVWKIVEAKTQ